MNVLRVDHSVGMSCTQLNYHSYSSLVQASASCRGLLIDHSKDVRTNTFVVHGSVVIRRLRNIKIKKERSSASLVTAFFRTDYGCFRVNHFLVALLLVVVDVVTSVVLCPCSAPVTWQLARPLQSDT